MAEASRPCSPRVSPIADPVGERLLERTGELAKRWAATLILARPLEAIGEVPLEQFAREAPSLCEQLLRAVRSNVELERLTDGQPGALEGSPSARRIAAISGASGPRETAVAVEALRGVLWEALLEELGSSAGLAGAVCDRLAHVCAAVLAAAVDDRSEPAASGAHVELAHPGPGAGAEPIAGTVKPASPAGRQAVIVDELAGARGIERRPSMQVDEAIAADRRAVAEIEIYDQRGEEGPSAWIGSIGAQLERFARDALPFAVLLVELAEIERLRSDEPARELARLAGEMEKTLALAAGTAVTLTRERPGRCWMLAADTDLDGARELADRLVAAASDVSRRGAWLEVAVGIATCPGDGREAATLAAYADVGLYAARAAIRASSARSSSPVDESR